MLAVRHRPLHHEVELLLEEHRLHAGRGVAARAAVRHDERVHDDRGVSATRRESVHGVTVSAASASGSGLLVSGDVGTHDSTVAVVAESRNSSFR